MNGKKIIMWSIAFLTVLAGVFLFVNQVSASGPITGNECGSSGPWVGDNGLLVKKYVFCEKTRTWNWTVDKQAAT